MKKQLLSIAMLASIFVVGNVLAKSGEASDSGSEKEKLVNNANSSSQDDNQKGDAGAGEQRGSDGSDAKNDENDKCGFCTKCRTFVSDNKVYFAIGGAVTAAVGAAKLVYDYVNKAEDEDEDLEDEEL